MPGILDVIPPPGINPNLLSASNLVSPNAPPTMQPSAIQAMTDAMRTGALTAQDVLDRTGELGKTARKAQIEMHKREIADLQDPDMVAARHAITLGAGQVASNQGAAAQAQQTLIPAQTQLQAGALAQGLSELGTGIPSATIRQLNLNYNLGAKFDPTTGVLQNPDEVLPNLTHVMGGLNGMQIAQELEKRIDKTPVTDAQGNTTAVPTWKGGQPLTPAQKGVLNHFNSFMPGLLPGGATIPVEPKPGETAPAKPVVDIPGATTTSVPATGPLLDASGNLITAQRTEPEKIKASMEIAEGARKQKSIQDWRTATSFYGNATDAISAINKVSIADQNKGTVNLNQRDVELAEAVVKMLDPEGAVREFKWDKLASGQPVMEQVHSVMARLTHNAQFVPGVRQELMKVANGAMRSRENAAADLLQNSAKLGGSMTDKENELVSGIRTPEYVPPGASTATSGGTQPMTRGGGKMISADGGKTWNWNTAAP